MNFNASRRTSLQLLLAMAALRPALAAVATSAEPAAAPVLKVVATFSILADMVREVGGPAVEVSALVGPNADAHVFEPTPSDVRRMARADLVVANGLRFEGWIDRLIEDVKKSPRFAKEAHRQEVLEIFHRGRRHYEKIASVQ
jgi:ABC-type Zn uptake system ZnuABC Zn-binding protein ZnuA